MTLRKHQLHDVIHRRLWYVNYAHRLGGMLPRNNPALTRNWLQLWISLVNYLAICYVALNLCHTHTLFTYICSIMIVTVDFLHWQYFIIALNDLTASNPKELSWLQIFCYCWFRWVNKSHEECRRVHTFRDHQSECTFSYHTVKYLWQCIKLTRVQQIILCQSICRDDNSLLLQYG